MTGSDVQRMATPQAIVFTILGSYFIDENPPIPTSLYLDVLGRVGVSTQASRMTLNRMKERGYLTVERKGREAFWKATHVAVEIVKRQRRLTFTERAAVQDPDDVWTIVTFSLPEAKRLERDQLRQRLAWEGFGSLRDGVWVSPGDRDLSDVMDTGGQFDLDESVDVFVGRPRRTDLARMIERAWHLPELIEHYEQFLAMWDVGDASRSMTDPLGTRLLLIATWRQLLRATPHLPPSYLPEDWPGLRCTSLFRDLEERYRVEARQIIDALTAGTPAATRARDLTTIGATP